MFTQQRGNEAANIYKWVVGGVVFSKGGFAKWSIYIIKKFLLKLTFLLEDLLKFCLNGFDVSFILAEKKEIKPPTLDLFRYLDA